MNLIIEIVVSLLFTAFGYCSLVSYFDYHKFDKLKKEKLIPNTTYKKVFLILALIIVVTLILFFHLLYSGKEIIHKVKLLSLILTILPLSFIDFKVQKFPNKLIGFAIFVRAIIFIVELIISPTAALLVLKDALFGALILGGFFFIVGLIFKGSVGMGDVKLFIVMALFQGFAGGFCSIMLSLIVFFFVAVFCLITKRKSRKDVLAFGPSALIGTLISMCITGM